MRRKEEGERFIVEKDNKAAEDVHGLSHQHVAVTVFWEVKRKKDKGQFQVCTGSSTSTIKPIELWKPGGLDKVLQVKKEAAWPSGKGAGLEIRRSRVHRDVLDSPWFNSSAALVHSQLVSLPASWDPKSVRFVSKSGVHVNYLER